LIHIKVTQFPPTFFENDLIGYLLFRPERRAKSALCIEAKP
jgi:hypothetical protein